MTAVLSERLETARRFLRDSHPHLARQVLGDLERHAGADPQLWRGMGEAYSFAGGHGDARRCYHRAARLRPNDPRLLYDLGSAQTAVGDLEGAEKSFRRVLAINPDDFDAWYNLVTLRRATPSANEVDSLKRAVVRANGGPGRVPAWYALAKDLEDIERYPESFAALQRGAEARRLRLSYRVQDDVETIDAIIATFTADLFASSRVDPDEAGDRPVFVLGLPRSGTTLVDRIVSSHSRAASLGEINDFALALTRRAAGPGGKLDMVRRCRELDFMAVGKDYLASTAAYEVDAPRRVDKTPANYLYLGLIALALPQARIIHMRRSPMDNLYALYKTLFRMGCPYSYSLGDLASYYAAYERLMQHWRAVLPGRFLEVDYEALVRDQEEESRRIVAWCGLAWEERCLRFHENASPSATASAAQVRQPIYATSVGIWRRYEAELQPLVHQLAAKGVVVEGRWP